MRGPRSEYSRLIEVSLALFGLPFIVLVAIGKPLVRYIFPSVHWLLLPMAKIVLSFGAIAAIGLLLRGLKTRDLTGFQRSFMVGLIVFFIIVSMGFWLVPDNTK